MDDGQLLIVLLAEEREMRLHYLEELQGYGRDAPKVARAGSATHVFGDFPDFHKHLLWPGYISFSCGAKMPGRKAAPWWHRRQST